ncbi:MAG TPA: hypothetical protein VKT72_18250 [Candidatus Baltobacteraceae bacterium]|nr:hypothetical protein [Candidatus Baltobacteraceae bacterium]
MIDAHLNHISEATLTTSPLGDSALGLVQETLQLVEAEPERLSAALRNAVRIARQTNAHVDLFWLRLELRDSTQKAAFDELFDDLKATVTPQQYGDITRVMLERYNEERSYQEAEGPIWKLRSVTRYDFRPIDEIEAQLAERVRADDLETFAAAPRSDKTANVDAASRIRDLENQRYIDVYSRILGRIRARLFDFLTRVEYQLLVGHISADIFQTYRRYVDLELSRIAPDVLEQFASIYKRIGEGDKEARSQALTSCRRVIKALADTVYPATNEMVKGKDGKGYPLDDEHYVLRLRQFVTSAAGKHKSSEVLRAQIGDLESRVEALNALSSKGTHAHVTSYELFQCAIQTYLVAGDVLRVERHRK